MELRELVGDVAESDTKRLRKARVHQGWWRAFVLKQEQGLRPNDDSQTICSTLQEETSGLDNFILKEIGVLALDTAEKHNNKDSLSSGMIQVNRLKNNLLSSQPLCFNFFGLLSRDKNLALNTLKEFFPEITRVLDVKFEYAPTPKVDYTGDNSAYDVAIEVEIDGKKGLIGIECKYTESFSPKAYTSERYNELYVNSSNFIGSYEDISASRFNQLFRNQIIAESLLQNNVYDFVKTALFCADDDTDAQETAAAFDCMLRDKFTVITFFDFISAMQKLDISEQQRKASMMLWARYSAYELSEKALNEY